MARQSKAVPRKRAEDNAANGHEAAADAQRRLLDLQASFERDSARLRELEARYRYLLSSSADAVLLIDGTTRRVAEANPAAADRFGLALANLRTSSTKTLFGAEGEAAVARTVDALLEGSDDDRIDLPLADGSIAHGTAALFRQGGSVLLMLRLGSAHHGKTVARDSDVERRFNDYFLATPDAVVLTDHAGRIAQANGAFLDLVQIATKHQVRGTSLGRWLGRTSVDLGVLITNLRQRGSLKLFATHLRAEHGALTDVEISAVALGDAPHGMLGFSIRDVGPRVTGSTERYDLPKSVSQLTELVGRLPMKTIVGNTADLIEQMCIRAALELTRDNRVAAAELLGLSRQSLYVKLRRYDMMDGDTDEEA